MQLSLRREERTNALIKSAVQLTLLVEFLEHRRTISSDEYCETLQSLRRSIKNKSPGLLTESVVMLMITSVHTFPGSHTRNWPSSSESSLAIHSTAWIGHPAISMCLVP
ncbi:hypothetical protein TNIN_28041 [Trichonephila inaurata madagascariensis]|uniref:Uncharacterized protein n=1 Tax=Trichonephila inaurata madagascariensis TaxID=2747483 RepID=A0A8X6XHC5_9ARAC|nr:hypothetical protein TNIN_28041 [Trichonephila inaurata madagascariensis]